MSVVFGGEKKLVIYRINAVLLIQPLITDVNEVRKFRSAQQQQTCWNLNHLMTVLISLLHNPKEMNRAEPGEGFQPDV